MRYIINSTHLYILLLFCFLLAIPAASVAQGGKPTTKITGLILTGQHQPVEFATVSLLRAKDSSLVKGALGNGAGIYVFERITADTYIIKATAVGYNKAITGPFTITESTATLKVPDLNMSTSAQALKTVSIQSTRPLIERKIDRTVMNVENSVLAAGNTAMEILERAPGVRVDKDDNISLQGKQGVTVMINDKLTYLSAAQLATLLRSTDGSSIATIEIITNPSAKYDAAGNSGIINIKLKKNRESGTSGSVSLGAVYGKYWRMNSSVNLNHKEGKLNLFGTFSHGDNKRYNSIDIDRTTRDDLNQPTYFSQNSVMPQISHYNNYRAGADYDLTNKNTIGFVVSGYSNSERNNSDNFTKIGAIPGRVDSSLRTVSNIDQTYKNFALNLNDRYKIDTAGQELGVDLDYSKFRNNSNAQYATHYFLANGGPQHTPQMLRNQTPSIITIYTAKVDYAKPITKTIKLETGVKYSNVKTDNDLHAQIQSGSIYINDTARTNHFIYDEKIDAGYLNLNKQFKKTSVQIGVRAEYTQSNGNLIGSAPVNRHYLDLFPSAFINHTINPKNDIGFSYSRRIDRPGYDNLNPFIYYLDPYTFSQGNAFLNPQYTNNFEMTYGWNKTINATLGYSHTTDVITEIILTEGKKSFQTTRNLQVQNAYSFNVTAPYTITKWWSGDINVNTFYLGFKSDTIANGSVNDGRITTQLRTTQTFTFAGYKAEVMGDYQSALTYGIYNIRPRYGVDAGISRSFAGKKANIKLSMNDVFNIRYNNISSDQLGNDFVIHQKNDSRQTRLTFTWNFGNSKIKARNHESGADAEKGRVKGSN